MLLWLSGQNSSCFQSTISVLRAYMSRFSLFPFKQSVSRAAATYSAVASLYIFCLLRNWHWFLPKLYFSLNYHVGNSFGSSKNFCQFCFTCVSVAFLFWSDPIADRALLCLEVGSREIYDIIFDDILAQCSRTTCHMIHTKKTTYTKSYPHPTSRRSMLDRVSLLWE